MRAALEEKITEQVLTEADISGRVDEAYRALEETMTHDTAELPTTVAHALDCVPLDQWCAPVEQLARQRVEET